MAPAGSQVATLDGAARDGGGEPLMGRFLLGDDQQTRRVLIQAMDDAGTPVAADGGESVHLEQQSVHQCPGRMSRRRVDHHAGRLVDDDD